MRGRLSRLEVFVLAIDSGTVSHPCPKSHVPEIPGEVKLYILWN